jgi:sugar O-acyltransferase (sialic acid O-acetyltransferase NeuD family)
VERVRLSLADPRSRRFGDIRPLLIVGAGGFARETAEAVRAINAVHPTWDLLGFLDDDPAMVARSVDGIPVLGSTESAIDHPGASVVVCTGSPVNFLSRRRLVERLGMEGARYPSLVHPAASLASSTSVGHGTVILAGVVTTAAVTIGAHVALMPQVVLTHDDVVADYVTVGAGARLAGGVHIGTGAYVGSGALIREHRSVGPWALVGMGSVVTKDIPSGEVWAGVPARFMRTLEHPV